MLNSGDGTGTMFGSLNPLSSSLVRTIWQTYETDYDSLHPQIKDTSSTWKTHNPDWEYRYMSSQDRVQFVQKHFDADWYELFTSIPYGIVQANVWRFMVLYVYGGLYTDLDTVCLAPIDDWITPEYKTIGFVDEEPQFFSLFTLYSSPESIVIKKTLDSLKNNLRNFSLEEFSRNQELYVINYFGEKVFTDFVLDVLRIQYLNQIWIHSPSRRESVVRHLGPSKDWESLGYINWLKDVTKGQKLL